MATACVTTPNNAHVCLRCLQPNVCTSLRSLLLRAQVMKVVFGQDLADESAGVAQQVFSVSVAIGGLAAFALVLALIEQVVLQVRVVCAAWQCSSADA